VLGAGRYRDRVEIQRLVETVPDEFGQRAPEVWETYATRWAAVETLQGRDLWVAQQAQPDVTHRVTLRSDELSVTTKDRLLWEGRVLNVETAPSPGSKGREIQLTCREAV
jgi:SPP1 family predicted phage head-tail adaptor